MTPLGHLSIACLASRTNRHVVLVAIALGSLLPDADYVFLFFPWFNEIHRVVTHNIPFVALIAFAGLPASREGMKGGVAVSLFLGGMLHLLVDACMDANPSNGTGVPLLWPFSDTFFCPVNLLASIQSSHGWAGSAEQVRVLVESAVWEAPLYVLAALVMVKKRRET